MQSTNTYQIILVSELTPAVLAVVNQDSVDTARKSLDDTKCIVSWEDAQPVELTGKTTYTHSEILAIINDEQGEWYVAPPPIPNP
jgi:hypothetical protein